MTTLGKYELHEQLGRGGFGTVYRAVDTTLKREVALKVLHPQLTTDPDFLERFQNEARLTASLDNTHIVPIYELAEADGRVFIAMKYLPGGSLKQRLEKDGAIPFAETLKIIREVCAGLEAAHKKGLVHRDVKPANILFDGEGKAVIGDFGLARAVQMSSATAASSAAGGAGTPAYRAPELWRGKPPARPATDVYSLGCVLSEMLTGRMLFSGDTPDEILARHLIDGPEIPECFPEGTPDGVRVVLEKAVAKEPLERYQTVTAFEEALEGCGQTPARVENREPDQPAKRRPSATESEEPGTVESNRLPKRWPWKKIGIIAGVVAALGLGVWLLGLIEPTRTKTTESRPTIDYSMAAATVQAQLTQAALANTMAAATVQAQLTQAALANPTLEPTPTTDPDAVHIMAAATVQIQLTQAALANPTAEPELGIGSSRVAEVDGMEMVYVPAGEFLMGSPQGMGSDDEHPQHTVFLDSYWIDKTEVTNGMYHKCIIAHACTPPAKSLSYTEKYYFLYHLDFPVVYVNWDQAKQYCAWAGRNLPSEAQWEKAARGADGRTYPWGNTLPNNSLANYNENVGDTTIVGSYSKGASPYGVLNMAGNVMEWVADWYGGNYYEKSPSNNPKGPGSGVDRVLRGGSWRDDVNNVSSAHRGGNISSLVSFLSGFRCAMDIKNLNAESVISFSTEEANNTMAVTHNEPLKTSLYSINVSNLDTSYGYETLLGVYFVFKKPTVQGEWEMYFDGLLKFDNSSNPPNHFFPCSVNGNYLFCGPLDMESGRPTISLHEKKSGFLVYETTVTKEFMEYVLDPFMK